MKWIATALLLVSALRVSAEDTIYLEETVISGNQELPRVLYILPWQDMATELLPRRAFEFSSQSVLVPVYPHEHKLQLGFKQTLQEARSRETTSAPQTNH